MTVPALTATPWTELPDTLRHKGESSAWAKMTRPDQPMHSFLEAAFFQDGNLWLSDVPYGRVFKVSPAGAVSYTHLRAHETSLHLVCRLLLEKNSGDRGLRVTRPPVSHSDNPP